MLSLFVGSQAISQSIIYTDDSHFDRGTLNGVIHTPSNQLQLSSTAATVDSFAWIANSGDGTISKINTVKGIEVGRYHTGPGGPAESPARVVVDREGNCWVANRRMSVGIPAGQGSVTYILKDGGVDRNGNGVIETSTGGSDIKPWGQDERVVRHYLVGSATGGIPRAVLVDNAGFLWVGLWQEHRVIKIKPDEFPITNGPLVSQTPHEIYSVPVLEPNTNSHVELRTGPYGLAMNTCGLIYLSTMSDTVHEIYPGDSGGGVDPAYVTQRKQVLPYIRGTYGIAVDSKGIVWLADYKGIHGVIRWDPCKKSVTYDTIGGLGWGRGVAVDFQDNIWVAYSNTNLVTRWNNSLNPTQASGFPKTVASLPVGIGIDRDGDIVVVHDTDPGKWSHLNQSDGNRVDYHPQPPDTIGSLSYTYGDFTGVQARRGTGDWIVDTCSGMLNNRWLSINWNATVPLNSSLVVKARAANDQASLASAAWDTVDNGVASDKLCGQCIQVKVTFKKDLCVPIAADTVDSCSVGTSDTPILYDLTINGTGTPCSSPCDQIGVIQRWQIPVVPNIQGMVRNPSALSTPNNIAWFTEYNEGEVGKIVMPSNETINGCDKYATLSEYNMRGWGNQIPFTPFKIAYGSIRVDGKNLLVWVTDPVNGKFIGLQTGSSFGLLYSWKAPPVTQLTRPWDIQLPSGSKYVYMTDMVNKNYIFAFQPIIGGGALTRWTLPINVETFYARSRDIVWLAGTDNSNRNCIAVLNTLLNSLKVWRMNESGGGFRAIAIVDSIQGKIRKPQIWVANRASNQVTILDSAANMICMEGLPAPDAMFSPKAATGARRMWLNENFDSPSSDPTLSLTDGLNAARANPKLLLLPDSIFVSKQQFGCFTSVCMYRVPIIIQPLKGFCEELPASCLSSECIIHRYEWKNNPSTFPADFQGALLDIDLDGVYRSMSSNKANYSITFHEPKHPDDLSGWVGRFITTFPKP